jgi:hypothetical protein
MKNLYWTLLLALGVAVTSCDKVSKIYEPKTYDTELDMTLYPGNWQDYLDTKWPNFDTITASSVRNLLIEDFTGHNCAYCPAAAAAAHAVHNNNPTRVFVSSIHSSNNGISSFQAVKPAYPVDFMNEQGLELGEFFGAIPSSGFFGNPAVGCSRIPRSGGEIYYLSGSLASEVASALNTSLKVKIKSKINYFEQTKGAFLHTEIEVLDPALTNLGTVAIIQQDSLIAPQNVEGDRIEDYVHRDIHRKHVTNSLWGVTLTNDFKKENGKYYVDYSFVVPNELTVDNSVSHDVSNMHVLVYVYDKTTYEVYQVVKSRF